MKRHFVSFSTTARALGVCALLLRCGGLAEDGIRGESARFDPDPDDVRSTEQLATWSAPEPQDEPDDEAGEPARAEGAGQTCGAPEAGAATGREGVAVGDVELRRAAQCGAAGWCLTRAAPAVDCAGTVRGVEQCANDDFIPVAPPRASLPQWQENTCTCRCDGEATDVDYCACPGGMRCAPLIPSAGHNAAARPFIGSYCVY